VKWYQLHLSTLLLALAGAGIEWVTRRMKRG
jgi:hypothetical protein